MGDGKQVYAKGRGTVEAELTVAGRKSYAKLMNVMYVPEMTKSLFSIGAAGDHGAQALFRGSGVEVRQGRRVIAYGSRCSSNGLYKLHMRALPAKQEVTLWFEKPKVEKPKKSVEERSSRKSVGAESPRKEDRNESIANRTRSKASGGLALTAVAVLPKSAKVRSKRSTAPKQWEQRHVVGGRRGCRETSEQFNKWCEERKSKSRHGGEPGAVPEDRGVGSVAGRKTSRWFEKTSDADGGRRSDQRSARVGVLELACSNVARNVTRRSSRTDAVQVYATKLESVGSAQLRL